MSSPSIASWLQDQSTRKRGSAHRKKPRAAAARPKLAEVSNNPQIRNPKASAASRVTKMGSRLPRRGRSGKRAEETRDELSEIHPAASSSAGAYKPYQSTPKSRSPTKRSVKEMGQSVTNAEVDLPFLEQCKPSTKLRSYKHVLDAKQIPSKVKDLWWRIKEMDGVLPWQMKDVYDAQADTPQKRGAPPTSRYVAKGSNIYPNEAFPRLQSFVEDIVSSAGRALKDQAHENQWTTIAILILGELRAWDYKAKWEILNVQNCTLEPDEIRPRMPDSTHFLSSDAHSISGASKVSERKTEPESPATMAKMVDLCLGLVLPQADLDHLNSQWSSGTRNEDSLNQSLKFIKSYPLMLDIEMKRKNQNRDPLVQLSIWNCGGMLKRKWHGWDSSMPHPAIEVNAHLWTLYLYYEWEGDLMMIGPISIGSTEDEHELWKLFYSLRLIIRWGTEDFETWVRKNMLAKPTSSPVSRANFATLFDRA